MYSDTSCPVTALHLLWYIVLILYEEWELVVIVRDEF